MDKMSFSLDYDCYYSPRFLDRGLCQQCRPRSDHITHCVFRVYTSLATRPIYKYVCHVLFTYYCLFSHLHSTFRFNV